MLFSVKVKTEDRTDKVKKSIEKAVFRNLGHAAATVARDARQSIKSSLLPSKPGEPPHTRNGGPLRRAIRFAELPNWFQRGFVVGPRASVIGDILGGLHERGGKRGKELFPKRPFMSPALNRSQRRLADIWRGSLNKS